MTDKQSTESFRVRNERKATAHALLILKSATERGVTPTDLFVALAAVMGNKNPYFARKTLEALEATVRARPVPVAAHESAEAPAPAGASFALLPDAPPPIGDECGCEKCTAEPALG